MTLQTVVEDLEALRQHLKQDRLVLIGHSWGGMLAMAYAVAHPERVDSQLDPRRLGRTDAGVRAVVQRQHRHAPAAGGHRGEEL